MDMIRDDLSNRIIDSARKLAAEKGAGRITVRDILKDLEISNRVFYNRFHNIDEVLDILYTESTQMVRKCLSIPYQEDSDFFEHVKSVACKTLIMSYETRQNLSQFIFETDSSSCNNFNWWNQEIKNLLEIGIKHHFLRSDLDRDAISYSIWCFIRGFNADALARNIPMDKAIEKFNYGFGFFLNGIRA